VDDIVLAASSSCLHQRIITALQQEFSMKDLGQLHHFLGMHVQRRSDGFLLSAPVHAGHFGPGRHGYLQALLYIGGH
jgi:hypothetical protein